MLLVITEQVLLQLPLLNTFTLFIAVCKCNQVATNSSQ